MSTFGGLMFTNKGRNLQAKAQTGVQLQFTKISLGDGALNGSAIADLTNLKNTIVNLPIERLRTLSGGRAEVAGILSNQSLTSGFYYRELGLFALDPQEGEILYCYGNSGNLAEYIPASGGADVIEKQIVIQTIVGNATNITAVIDTSLVYATVSDMNLAIQQNLTDSKAYTNTEIDLIEQQITDLENQLGLLTSLETEQKANLVAAINELKSSLTTHLAEDATTTKKGHVQLSNSITGTSEAKAVTEKALKTVYDEVRTKQKGITSLVAGANINTVTETGDYFGYDFINGAENQISTFEVLRYSVDWLVQFQHVLTNGVPRTYKRAWHSGSTWSPWVRELDMSMVNVPNGVLGLDANGKAPVTSLPQGADVYELIYSTNFATNSVASLNVGNLSGYKKLKVLGKKMVGTGPTTRNLNLLVNNYPTNTANYNGSFLLGNSISGASSVTTNFQVGSVNISPHTFTVEITAETNMYPMFDSRGATHNTNGSANNVHSAIGLITGLSATPITVDSLQLVLQGNLGAETISSGVFEIWGVRR